MHALDFDETPGLRDRRLRSGCGVADSDRRGQAEHVVVVADMLDCKLERPLPVSRGLARAAAAIHQQLDLERRAFFCPPRRRLHHRADQHQAGRSSKRRGDDDSKSCNGDCSDLTELPPMFGIHPPTDIALRSALSETVAVIAHWILFIQACRRRASTPSARTQTMRIRPTRKRARIGVTPTRWLPLASVANATRRGATKEVTLPASA